MKAPLRQRIESWSETLDSSYRGHARWGRLQLLSTLNMLGLIALAAWVPFTRDFFRMEPWVPLGSLVAARGFLLAAMLFDRSRGLRPTGLFAVALTCSLLEELLATSLFLYAEPPGAFALAPLPLLRAVFDGITLGAGLDLPHLALAHGAGMLFALALRPDAEQAWFLWLLVPAAVLGFQIASAGRMRFGRDSALQRRQRRELELRAVDERRRALESLNEGLVETMAHSHDARSALGAARLRIERIVAATRELPDLAACARALDEALLRVERAIDEERRSLREPPEVAGVPGASVAVQPLLRAVLDGTRRRHEGVSLSASGDTVDAFVLGGEASLRQLLEHLVANACEGDGRHGARVVEANVFADPGGRALAIEVSDDGPGFLTAQLAAPIAPFSSTKPYHAGLGLYTAERLARASGGSIRRENLPAGGARVTAYLHLPRG